MAPFFPADSSAIHKVVRALVICLLLAGTAWLSRQTFGELPAGDYNSYQCSTGSPRGPAFRILTLTSQGALEMADHLCRSPVMGRWFSAVEVTWRPRSYLTAHHLVEEAFDFFWNREHLVKGMVPNVYDYYRRLLDTAGYPVYWISRDSQPRLTADYFAGKTLGLVKDANSQTFFLRPMAALRDAGIALRPSGKRFYADMNSLYQAFADGEVDIIPGTHGTVRDLGIDNYYSLLLAEDVPSGSWFLRARWSGGGIECELAALRAIEPFRQQLPRFIPRHPDCP